MHNCAVCKKKHINKISLMTHLKETKCAEIYVDEKGDTLKHIPNDIYNNIGVNNIVKKYFSIENGYGKSKKHAVELLEKTIKILKEFEIDYFAISGTLLGIVRHNDIIPWDDDIDLLVDGEIKNKIYDIYNKYCDELHFIKNGNMLKICYIDKDFPIINNKKIKDLSIGEIKRYNYPFVDLFVMEKKDEHLYFFEKMWDIQNFYPVKEVVFLDMKINIPCNPEFFLNNNYGLSWNKILISNYWCHKYERIYKKMYKISIDDYSSINKFVT